MPNLGGGTLRENRLGGSPFSHKKALEKQQRGAMEWLSDGDNLVVRWNDNRVVTVATNCEPLEPSVTASRYVKKQGGRISVEMPGPLHSYNTHMGGVDLFDQCVALYRSTIRSKGGGRSSSGESMLHARTLGYFPNGMPKGSSFHSFGN